MLLASLRPWVVVPFGADLHKNIEGLSWAYVYTCGLSTTFVVRLAIVSIILGSPLPHKPFDGADESIIEYIGKSA